VTLLDDRRVLGRGPPQADDPAPRVTFLQLRPWGGVVTPPLQDTRISRIQLVLSPLPDGEIGVTSVGRCPLSPSCELSRMLTSVGMSTLLFATQTTMQTNSPTAGLRRSERASGQGCQSLEQIASRGES
jgi:hypothetical protein